jgi:hypothetical protein
MVIFNAAVPHKVRLEYLSETGSELGLIPTGVYVQSVEFSSANNVTVTGYVWQRFAPGLPPWVLPAAGEAGFILPESETTALNRAYEREDETGRLVGWYFKAVLRQEFDYSHHPFDSEVVWVRLWPSQIARPFGAPAMEEGRKLIETIG